MTIRSAAYQIAVALIAAVPILILPALSFGQGAGVFENPLRFRTIEQFVEGALQAFAYIALPAIGFFIVLSGFYFISAQGNQEKLNTAKKNFVYVVTGAALILGAWALAVLIKGTIDQLRG